MRVALATNWLGLEAELIARIRSEVPGLLEVGGALEYDAMLRAGNPVPAAYVLYRGYRTEVSPARARRPRLIAQHWSVVLLAGTDPASRETILPHAGAALSSMVQALDGWPELGEPCRGLGLTEPLEDISEFSPPVIYAGGFVEFVQTYRARMQLN